MSGGGGGGRGLSAVAAGPVPASARKLVQGLKEIVNRPDAEIYAALRDCGMDPDEAVSRLHSQDTFQEVKSKRDKKKETHLSQDLEEQVTQTVVPLEVVLIVLDEAVQFSLDPVELITWPQGRRY